MLKLISWFTRHIQLKGAPRLLWTFRAPFVRKDHLYPVECGLKLKLDESQLYQWWYAINYAGYELVLLFQRLLREGDLVIDVGANIGYITLNAARQVGATGCVYAIEPSPETMPRLQENIALNGINNVRCLQLAVSDCAGDARFNIATDAGLSRIEDVAGETFGHVLKDVAVVQTETLDETWRKVCGGGRIRLIKLDIEGYEYRALCGGENLLKHHCDYVVTEINAPALLHNGVTLRRMVDLLERLGYETWWIKSHSADWFRVTRMPSLDQVISEEINANESGEMLFVNAAVSGEFRSNCGSILRLNSQASRE